MTGAQFIPPPSASPVHCPLIIALHGGGYDHQYFDATPKTSPTVASTAFGVPFVSVDRPSYGGTSSVLPIPDHSSSHLQSGDLLHRQIIPEIWREIGIPNSCNCVVVFCHSFGVMSGTVTAAMHAKDEKPSYSRISPDHLKHASILESRSNSPTNGCRADRYKKSAICAETRPHSPSLN